MDRHKPIWRALNLRRAAAALVVFAATLALPAADAAAVPRPDHVVVVVMENHAYDQVIGSSSAPYINRLAAQGALFTSSFAISHPSEPNYLALFSGSDQGVGDDSCPHTFSAENLGHELIATRHTFAGFSEDLPKRGYTGCDSGNYARRHNPWVNFTNVPSSANLPFSRFPSSYSRLPTVSFVVPNLCHDMHDCGVQTGDGWLRAHLAAYARWAKSHHSLLVLTWDEDDDNGGNNQIATIFFGAGIKPGHYGERIDHYRVLRTIEDMYRLRHAGNSAHVRPISDVWSTRSGRP
jgi:phosphatidylinositol-3-phosphatase